MYHLKLLLLSILSFLFGCKTPDKSEFFKTQNDTVFYRDEAVPQIDAKTFEVLDDHLVKDKNHVWYCDTYRSGQDYFLTRRNNVTLLEKADPATFRKLNKRYARDKDHLFFEGVFFPVKDINTFEILDYSFARDKISGYYMQVEIPGSDGSTFTGLDSHYAKDTNHVYYASLDPGEPVTTVILKDADVASFAVLDNATDSADAKDRHTLYFRGKPAGK